ncbi:hypothetical protein [Kibdelosporangium phytohabitans]|uniref:hypothetical protein n=1 Tax=Kibdelosporangium phytohabitans TaxID=860235 RepID=UPI0012FCFD03|nr:hypothetical protein [Kibdelosporangium phytohabitans]MBE1471133.1 hypothetical protein [Kibdelosporangium phytohabitans]
MKDRNLKGFLIALSDIAGYRFDEWDWDAFVARMSDRPEWFTYPLAGRATVEVAVARDAEEGHVGLRLSVPGDDPCLAEKIEVAWRIFNHFDVSAVADFIV